MEVYRADVQCDCSARESQRSLPDHRTLSLFNNHIKIGSEMCSIVSNNLS